MQRPARFVEVGGLKIIPWVSFQLLFVRVRLCAVFEEKQRCKQVSWYQSYY